MSAFSGKNANNDITGTGTDRSRSGSHTVRGIGKVQSAALKRITGAAAVGARIDAESNDWLPRASHPQLKTKPLNPRPVPDVVKAEKGTF